MSDSSQVQVETPPPASELTATQLAIWRGQQLHPDLPLYNMAHSFRLRGVLDVECFSRAFAELVRLTDALRIVIIEDGEIPRQRVSSGVSADLDLLDFSSRDDREARLRQWVEQRCRRRFLPDAALFDSALIRLGPEEHVWYFCQHHVTTDFLSIRLLADRLAEIYASLQEAGAPVTEDYPTFATHIEWLARTQTSKGAQRARAYWDARQAAPADQIELYGNLLSQKNAHARRLHAELGAERSTLLAELATTKEFRGLTPEFGKLNLLATLLLAYLHRISNRDRLTLGVPFHNRSSAAMRETVGLLINILPLQVDIEAGETLRSLHGKLAAENLNALKYSSFSPSHTEQHRGVDAILNYLTASFTDFAGLTCEFDWHHSGYSDAHHALRLQVHDFSDSGALELFFDFNADVLEGQEAHRPPEHFLMLADALLGDPDREIATVDLLTPDDRRNLITEFNATSVHSTPEDTIVGRFRAQSRQTPDQIAIKFGERQISYRELDAHSDALTSELHARGIRKGDTVALLMPRCPELISAMLGVMKSGAVYLPLDPAHPRERLQMIIADACPGALLRCAAHPEPDLTVGGPELTVNLDAPCEHDTDVSGFEAPTLDDLAYVIYTSGSTGKPKGTLIEHRGLANYLEWAGSAYFVEDDAGRRPASFAFFSSAAFDLSVTSIFLPLVTGATVVIYGETDPRNDLAVLDVFREDSVDIVKLTPAHLSLVRTLDVQPRRLRSLILGGEDLPTELARAIWERYAGRVEIFNEYGPTETVVGCMLHRYDLEHDTAFSTPIGRPIRNMQIHLLDRHGMPVPPGMTGEIFIAGAGVARGYMNRPEETARAFVPHPQEPALRLYRSGDLGRQDSLGTLTYLGRADQQLKLRGYRVEPAEIVSALCSHPQVRSAHVDVVRKGRPGAMPVKEKPREQRRCKDCGLPESFPGAALDDALTCGSCRLYSRHRERIDQYFRSRDELVALARQITSGTTAEQQCIVLLSGGKDSTYALCQLVELGLKPLVFTLDNGYISEQAMSNVHRVVDMLGLELVVGTTPYMNEIFVDSLERHCNVCNGCFKTLYTLSVNLAVERGIGYIFTGLSRGQLFETRLAPELFVGKDFSIERIERDVDTLRRDYHRRRDVVTERLDVSAFSDPGLFERVRIVDFYRYWDVELSELLEYLAREVSWMRPEDTGRSSNCLINDAGIFVHTRRRGYHNYALPYSWDVRLGHKTRDEAVAELTDSIDVSKVEQILGEIGYEETEDEGSELQLVAYYETTGEIASESLRSSLEQHLPAFMLPGQYVRVAEMPLTSAGKVDRAALARLADGDREVADYVAPRSDLEATLTSFWQEVLGFSRIGVEDNFFDLGGTSLPALQIVARVKDLLEIDLPLRAFFSAPTVAGLAENVEAELLTQLEAMSDEQAKRLLDNQ